MHNRESASQFAKSHYIGQSRAADTLECMLMSPETARFVAEHRLENVRDLALKAKRADGLDLPFALDQIAGWQTAQGKLPQWAACEGIVYPPHISMEQCSSEFTARYKAEVARRIVGESEPQGLPSARGAFDDSRLRGEEGRSVAPLSQSATDSSPRRGESESRSTGPVPGEKPGLRATRLVDLTGGFGVDFSYMARGFAQATYVERQERLCELAEHNMRALGLGNVTIVNADAESVLGELEASFRPGAASGAIFDEAQGARSTSRSAADSRPATTEPAAVAASATVVAPSPKNAAGVFFMARPSRGDQGFTSPEAKGVRSPACSAGAGDAPIALIFLDPARRDEHGGRTVAIEDCTPDALALRDRLLAAAPHVMVKLSPMLDWRKAVADFRGAVSEVHIVSTGNECKELLLVLDRRRAKAIDGDGNALNRSSETGETSEAGNGAVRVYCVNDIDRLDYDYDPANTTNASAAARSLGLSPLPEPIAYLYEPNASIMKAGCFALIEDRYGLTQIGPNSHLFVSGDALPIDSFPGRRFAVDAVTAMGKKELRRALSGVTKANIAVRNFPLTVAQLRGKLRLGDGGDTYLFATTLAGGKHVILRCSRLRLR